MAVVATYYDIQNINILMVNSISNGGVPILETSSFVSMWVSSVGRAAFL